MSNTDGPEVEGVEVDPEVVRDGQYGGEDSSVTSDLDSTRSASITSSIVHVSASRHIAAAH